MNNFFFICHPFWLTIIKIKEQIHDGKCLKSNLKFLNFRFRRQIPNETHVPGAELFHLALERDCISISKCKLLQNVLPIRGADILSLSDITDPAVKLKIREKLAHRQVDVVLSDMAPNPTGDNATDHLRLIELCRSVFRLFSVENEIELVKNGVYLCKVR